MFDKKLDTKFNHIKRPDEKIIWTGYPQLLPFILSSFYETIKGLILFVIFMSIGFLSNTEKMGLEMYQPFLYFFALVVIIPSIIKFIYDLVSFNRVCYGYSKDRIFIRNGIKGDNFKIINLKDITEMEVTVNLVEKLFSVGTIQFHTNIKDDDDNKIYDKWQVVEQPHEIFKNLNATKSA